MIATFFLIILLGLYVPRVAGICRRTPSDDVSCVMCVAACVSTVACAFMLVPRGFAHARMHTVGPVVFSSRHLSCSCSLSLSLFFLSFPASASEIHRSNSCFGCPNPYNVDSGTRLFVLDQLFFHEFGLYAVSICLAADSCSVCFPLGRR